MMENRAGFSDSNEISNNSSSSCVMTAGNVVTSLARPSDVPTIAEVSALQLLSNNLESLFESSDSSFSDVKLVLASGGEVCGHRCLMSSRSPFFKSLFSSAKESGGGSVVKFEVKELARDYDVGFDSLVAVLVYLYTGRVRSPPKEVCQCADEECNHVACRPAVDFLLEVLYLAFTFQISELVARYQRHLLDILDNVAVDDILVILSVSNVCEKGCKELLDSCTEIIVKSNVDAVTLEKSLPQKIVKHIMDSRIELGLETPEGLTFPDKHVKRIHRALDSDDVELVRMLLKEGHTNLDDANALHYAVQYCDAKTTRELLDLRLADVNHRNSRGYAVLHVAAMRKEPNIIISLLTKGAQPSDLTSGGRKAVQIAKQLTKAVDYHKSTEQGKASPKDRLCIDLLDQAERQDSQLGEASMSLAIAGDNLRSDLLYLENRVALARLLFPMEAQLAMEIAQVPGTSEFNLSGQFVGKKWTPMDLNEAPFIIQEEHLRRRKALSRTVDLGKHFFPRCSEVLNKIMDADDLSHLACIENDTTEERLLKRKRYMELQDDLSKAFNEDKEDKDKSDLPSSSSSASKSIGTVRPNRKLISRSR